MNTKDLSNLEEKVLKIINEEYELVDIEYVKEFGENYLRIYIDRDNGLTLDDCESISEKVSNLLDEIDIIEQSYYLEVSSPGIDRVLKKEKDFIREKNKKVDIKFYKNLEGKNDIVATLLGIDDDGKILFEFEGRDFSIDKKDIAKINLHIDF